MRDTVAVALSGGLDSAVAAVLLKMEGYRVLGVHFKTGYERTPVGPGLSESLSQTHSAFRRIPQDVGISLEILDLSKDFEEEVVRYFVRLYRSGQTPNPCMVCNERIKFGLLLKRARALGASHLATGHYARIEQDEDGRFSLLKGVDPAKDQSYFLARLTQHQLKQALFPLGNYTKGQVQKMARDRGLESHHGRESQELCFVKDDSYKAFLARSGRLPDRPGPIVTAKGKMIGHHRGLHNYTVGQRRGINVPGPAPYYVIRLDPDNNRLVVGFKPELAATKCLVTRINWIKGEPPAANTAVFTRLRYRHCETESSLSLVDPHTARVHFHEPQNAITPGQAAVFYEGDRVLGGGWIVSG